VKERTSFKRRENVASKRALVGRARWKAKIKTLNVNRASKTTSQKIRVGTRVPGEGEKV